MLYPCHSKRGGGESGTSNEMASDLWNFLVFDNFVEVPLKTIQPLQDTKFLKCFYFRFTYRRIFFSSIKTFFLFVFFKCFFISLWLCQRCWLVLKCKRIFKYLLIFFKISATKFLLFIYLGLHSEPNLIQLLKNDPVSYLLYNIRRNFILYFWFTWEYQNYKIF